MKSRLMIMEICGIFLLCMNMHGQYRIEPAIQKNGCSLTGNLQYDLSTDINGTSNPDSSVTAPKVVYKRLYSPLRAGLFSAVIPGAGQFYTKCYLKGSLHLGAEVLLWVLYASYEKKGDDQTTLFQNYADENWSVVRYTGWINTNFSQAIFINPDQNLKSWERVHWDELNAAEEAIGGNLTKTGFTHKLAPHGDQQYYEMIGKYAQFVGGWDDAWNGSTQLYNKDDVLTENVTSNFLKYRDMRGKANSFYNIGTTVSYIIIANHVFSALEAAWNASKLNHRIKLQGSIESRQIYGKYVEFVPTIHLEYEL